MVKIKLIDPSEIIKICWFGAQGICIVYQCWKYA